MSDKLRPLGNRIVVRPEKAPEKSKGGILIPERSQERDRENRRGEVLACGRGKLLDSGEVAPMQIACGNVVLIPKYAGTEVKVDDVEYVICDADEVFAVIE